MLVMVGSTNPVKVEVAQAVFTRLLGASEVRGVAVPSGVAEQPLSDDEAYAGAVQRARAALGMESAAAFAVGIESGCHRAASGDWLERAHVIVLDAAGSAGYSVSAGFVIPPDVSRLLRHDFTINDAVSECFGLADIGQERGLTGLITGGRLNRAQQLEQAVIYAASRFLHPEWYAPQPSDRPT